MARLPLVYYPDVVLKTRCADITDIDDALVTFAADMAETMYTEHGIGLAAPQVARAIRLMTVDVEGAEDGLSLLTLINPVITDSHGRTTYDEGCLSFPGVSIAVRRRDEIHLEAYGIDGREIDLQTGGLLSICIQHELDHLNGITFLDRLSPVQRKRVLRDYLADRETARRDEELERISNLHEEESP